jgi:CBS domain-containing protein
MHRLRSVVQRQQLISAPPAATVFEVAKTMSEGGVGALPILDGDELVGVFSERDLMGRVIVPGRDPRTTAVGEVMTRDVVTASLEDHVDFCLEKMQRAGCRHLPIIAGGRVISMISMRDLLRDELQEQDEEIQHLKAYLHQPPPS